MKDVFHALVLNLHQPPSNLDRLLDTNPWEAKEILFAYDRMPRTLWSYADLARVHLSMSGTLLETLSHPDFQRRAYGIVDCGTLLWALQNTQIFDILGTGYYHPVLALTPEADWDEHIRRWQAIAGHIFWRKDFGGFWPPEMGFDAALIPHLVKAGYRYVLVDSEYVDPVGEMSWQELRYRPHWCRFGDAEIIVVVRDRDLSNAQLAGMEYGWFASELAERTKWCDFPPLITTATDGDNGGWFRNVNPKANFWNYFYTELLDEVRAGRSQVRPTHIDAYLDQFGAHGYVTIRRGAWNTDTHHGWNFHQWQGGEAQRQAMGRVHQLSAAYHRLKRAAERAPDHAPDVRHHLGEAEWLLLRAETSCNFYWGDAWVHKSHGDLDGVAYHVARADELLGDLATLPDPAAAAEPAAEALPEAAAAEPAAEAMPEAAADAAAAAAAGPGGTAPAG
jgi:alpha-amylase/alpha-mannosidase (GH57 family)